MKKRMVGGVALFAMVWVSAVPALAGGTLDRRLLNVSFGKVELGGDMEMFSDVFDDIYTYGVGVALPLGDYFALLGSVNRTTTSASVVDEDLSLKADLTALAFSGGARLHLKSDYPLTPFVTALYSHTIGEAKIRTGAESGKIEITEGSVILNAGLELALGDRFSVMAAVSRIMEQNSDLKINGEDVDLDDVGDEDFDEVDAGGLSGDDKEDITIINAAVNFWLTDNFVISALVAYDIDNETRTYQASLGLSF